MRALNCKGQFFSCFLLVFLLSGSISLGRAAAQETAEKTELDGLIERLEAMEKTLGQSAEVQAPLSAPVMELADTAEEEIIKTEAAEKGEIISAGPPGAGEIMLSVAGLILVLGFLAWHKFSSSRTVKRLKELRLELQRREKLLEQEEIVRKTVEKTALEKERQIELELQEKSRRLKEETFVREEKEEQLTQREKELGELKSSYELLEGVLIKKELVKRAVSSDGKKGLWIPGESKEKRRFLRLTLTQDYNRTIISRIESLKAGAVKSFVSDISSEGLCFKARREFKENDSISLRLFFYGDQLPILKARAQIIWRRRAGESNYYGASLNLLDEKDKLLLDRYIEKYK